MSGRTRRELLQAVRDHVGRTGEVTLPWAAIPGLAAEFRDREDLLRTLHQRWYARFTAALDPLLEDPPHDIAAEIAVLWTRLCNDDPHARALLDTYRSHPALAAAEERQRRMLATATHGQVTTFPPTPTTPGRHDPPDAERRRQGHWLTRLLAHGTDRAADTTPQATRLPAANTTAIAPQRRCPVRR